MLQDSSVISVEEISRSDCVTEEKREKKYENILNNNSNINNMQKEDFASGHHC